MTASNQGGSSSQTSAAVDVTAPTTAAAEDTKCKMLRKKRVSFTIVIP